MIDIQTNSTTALLESPLLEVSPNSISTGTVMSDGIEYLNNEIFFTDYALGTYAHFSVDATTGQATSEVKVAYNYLPDQLEDFAIAPSGNTYLSTLEVGGGILRRAAGTPDGVENTVLVVPQDGTNFRIAQELFRASIPSKD